MRPTDYLSQLGAFVMTVGRISQSQPSNMIVIDSHNVTMQIYQHVFTVSGILAFGLE
jgi:hypothetical protein